MYIYIVCSTVPVFTQLNNFLCGFLLPNLSEKAKFETFRTKLKACLFEALKHGLKHHRQGICETFSRSFEEEETPSDASTADKRHKQRQNLMQWISDVTRCQHEVYEVGLVKLEVR